MDFLRQVFSENGEASSKRVAGVGGLFILHALVLYAGIRYGITTNVESICITLALMDGALLGITTIANAIK